MKRTDYEDACYRAAMSIACDHLDYACSALRIALEEECLSDYDRRTILTVFAVYFYPGNTRFQSPWFGARTIKDNQMARSLALLFLAEFIEEEM